MSVSSCSLGRSAVEKRGLNYQNVFVKGKDICILLKSDNNCMDETAARRIPFCNNSSQVEAETEECASPSRLALLKGWSFGRALGVYTGPHTPISSRCSWIAHRNDDCGILRCATSIGLLALIVGRKRRELEWLDNCVWRIYRFISNGSWFTYHVSCINQHESALNQVLQQARRINA